MSIMSTPALPGSTTTLSPRVWPYWKTDSGPRVSRLLLAWEEQVSTSRTCHEFGYQPGSFPPNRLPFLLGCREYNLGPPTGLRDWLMGGSDGAGVNSDGLETTGLVSFD